MKKITSWAWSSEEGFPISESVKGYKTQRHIRPCQLPSYTTHTYLPLTISMSEPFSIKKEKSSPPLRHSLKRKQVKHTSQLWSRIAKYSENYLPIACLSIRRNMLIFRLEWTLLVLLIIFSLSRMYMNSWKFTKSVKIS